LAAVLPILVPVRIYNGGWQDMNARAYPYCLISGAFYVVDSLGLHQSFRTGPERLVPPIVGAYPVLSVGWAALNGQVGRLDQWLAVLAVVLGMAIAFCGIGCLAL